jgi:type II secretory pathway pseudopilin PulG
MVVTLSLFSILLAMGIGALSYYSAAKSLDTAAREIATQMREAQAMAVATGNTYRVDFSDNARHTYQLQRRQGDSYEAVRNPVSLPSGVEFDASSLPSFGGDSYLDFYARGSAESGQLVLKGGYGRTRVIYVDGVTANVRIE